MMAIIEIIDATDSLLQNIIRIFVSVDLSLIFQPEDPGDHAELRVPKSHYSSTCLVSETKSVTPNFYFIFDKYIIICPW